MTQAEQPGTGETPPDPEQLEKAPPSGGAYAHLVLAVLVAPFLLLRAMFHGREGAGLFLLGTLAIVLTTFHDILISLDGSLWSLQWIDGRLWLQPLGLLVFLLSQSVMLALRSSRGVTRLKLSSRELRDARDRVDAHARELEEHVTERTERLEEANRMLERLAQVDGLTGIGNRRFFDEQLAAAWRDHLRRGASLALVMIDVDQFKRFNDDQGHVAGDEALRAIAGELEQTLQRPRDLMARYGGEELAALLPDTGQEGAMRLAERMRSRIRALGIPRETGDPPVVTISLGVASEIPRAARSPQELVQRADAALYRAKELGRNRVEAAVELKD
jgi:diguanylate cyclase (GGDEF)-like protein